MNGDGVPEVIVSLVKHPVNDCVSICVYQAKSQTLRVLEFEAGNMFNLEKRKSYLVSTHRNGAKWIEDIYAVRDKEYGCHCAACEILIWAVCENSILFRLVEICGSARNMVAAKVRYDHLRKEFGE